MQKSANKMPALPGKFRRATSTALVKRVESRHANSLGVRASRSPNEFCPDPRGRGPVSRRCVRRPDHLHPVHENIFHPDRVLLRLRKGGAIGNRRRIKDNDIGKHSFLEKTAMIEPRFVGGQRAQAAELLRASEITFSSRTYLPRLARNCHKRADADSISGKHLRAPATLHRSRRKSRASPFLSSRFLPTSGSRSCRSAIRLRVIRSMIVSTGSLPRIFATSARVCR